MDRNQVIGIVLMILVLIGFSYYRADQAAEEMKAKQAEMASSDSTNAEEPKPSVTPEKVIENVAFEADSSSSVNDSVQTVLNQAKYGIFYKSVNGSEEFITIETDLFKAKLSNKGGYIAQLQLKGHKTYYDKPLVLFDKDSSSFAYEFNLNGQNFRTDEFFFQADQSGFKISGDERKTISFSLKANSGEEIIHEYTFSGNDYLVDHQVKLKGLGNQIKAEESHIVLDWKQSMPTQEKKIQAESMVASVFYYDTVEDEDDYLSEGGDDQEIVPNPIKWACFKQQYFSSFIIADGQFGANSDVSIKKLNSEKYVKRASAELQIPFNGSNDEVFKTKFFFGPTQLELLDSYELEMGNIVNFGIGLFHWMNKYFIGPMFNFFMGMGMNIGLAILLLTIVIKLILTPITYKNYLSSAKMRVLKPRIDKINEENKDADPVKKQQAMMELYRSTGINPAAGCIPPLLQMPILFAMFRFFPNAFELRQKSFLWAEDLSAYDSILDLSQWGIDIPFYGDHISLFTLLMAVSIFFYSRFNSQMTPTTGNEMQAKQMKIMMNFMPVMMLFFFNNYAAGLSYYYFLSNVISIGQTVMIRKLFINEEEILKKIEEHMKKPMKKSRWQRKMEEISQKQQRK